MYVPHASESAPLFDFTLVVLASGVGPEAGLAEDVVRTYTQALTDIGVSWEVLLVDDGAPKEFFAWVKKMSETLPNTRGVRFRRQFGESIAIATAVGMARGRNIITTTWYQQVGVDAVRQAVSLLREGDGRGNWDYVAVRRQRRVDSWPARLQSWAFNAFTRRLTGVGIHDLNASFRAFRREVVADLSIHGDLFRFIPVFASQKGFRVREISVQHVREEGPSTFLNLGLYVRRFLDILSLFFLLKFTKKPLRFFGLVGSVFFVVGFAISAWMTWLKIVRSEGLADKPLLVLGVFLLVLGIIVASIGLIGEIIIFLQGNQLKDYSIDTVVSAGRTDRPETT
jgi:glycosyltransferase involved in cell wall biosynthesis